MSASLLAGLDPEQRAAAAVEGGPLLVVAGPGTGKTRTLTHRIAHLVTAGEVPPEHCLAITFTRRAAAEMAERLETLAPEAAPAVTVATFHSLGLRLLREQHERVGLPPDFGLVDRTQQRAIADETTDSDYRERLRERGLVDFDDLIDLPLALLEADPDLVAAYRDRFRWVWVDEYQDVDERQYRLLRQLVPPDGNITAIGDPDQAIYRFRGADVGFFLRFREDFPDARTVQLTRNYRSSAPILSAARQLIAPTSLVPDRKLRPMRDHGNVLVGVHQAASEQAEAAFVARTIEQVIGGASFHAFDSGRVDSDGTQGLDFSDFAVLYRTDRQSGAVMDALTQAGLPFQKRSHDRLAERPGVDRLLDELAFVPAEVGAARAAVLDRLRQAGEAVLERVAPADREEVIAQTYAAIDVLSPLAERCGDDLERFRAELALGVEVDTWDPRADRISLLTLHAAKGLEFPVVFIVGCEDGLLPLRWSGATDVDDEDVREERRLLFVGMTRAQRHLFLSHAAQRLHQGTRRDVKRSPFLDALAADVWERIGESLRRRKPRATQLRLL